MDEAYINGITERIIAAAIRVRKELGLGFLEKIYENSLRIELRLDGLEVEQQKAISVFYKGEVVGEYFADLLVARCVIVELKAARAMEPVFLSQALNYLEATKMPVALVLNFGPERLDVKRIVGSAFKSC
jgi:GxxExxY protein